MSERPHRKITIGISSCLLGEPVRYDGGHRYDSLINTQLAGLFEFRPCCPETAIGLGVPRDPVQLVNTDHGICVRAVDDPNIDITRKLENYGHRVAGEFTDICGYIFKARSPSCGIEDVATWTEQGIRDGTDGTGAFAAVLIRTCPGLPFIDETRLQDPGLRENFIERVLAWHLHHHPEGQQPDRPRIRRTSPRVSARHN